VDQQADMAFELPSTESKADVISYMDIEIHTYLMPALFPRH
jgi:hypothetical protein